MESADLPGIRRIVACRVCTVQGNDENFIIIVARIAQVHIIVLAYREISGVKVACIDVGHGRSEYARARNGDDAIRVDGDFLRSRSGHILLVRRYKVAYGRHLSRIEKGTRVFVDEIIGEKSAHSWFNTPLIEFN